MNVLDKTNDEPYDYIIAGGGTAGCVLASRLKQGNPSLRILLVEAGSNEHNNPQVLSPLATASLHKTPLQWNYKSVPQKHLNDRRIDLYGGKILSGSSGVNYALWTRCHSADWDFWADIADDDGWRYDNMLPYFRKTESYHGPAKHSDQHGYEGPIITKAGGSEYPLRDATFKMWSQIGLPYNEDANTGDPFGVAVYSENWHDGKRQPSGLAYGLAGVDVLIGTLVHKLVIEESSESKTVKGIEIDNGRQILASREVIVCSGAMRSPQLLMLSGIGPSDQLNRLGIHTVLDNPYVGANLHDHPALAQFWKLKEKFHGKAEGTPEFDDNPEHKKGFPMEWLITASIPEEEWHAAAEQDKVEHLYQRRIGPRADIETLLGYGPLGAAPGFEVTFDGTYVSTACLALLPTSRGQLKLDSADITTMPLLDPNYCATESDMLVMRHAMRMAMRAIESPEGQATISHEVVPDGWNTLTSTSSDADLDKRIRATVRTWYHPAGTLALGTVVDGHCRVKGIENLRVVDASIFPAPMSGHYQAPIYAIAERMADLILKSN